MDVFQQAARELSALGYQRQERQYDEKIYEIFEDDLKLIEVVISSLEKTKVNTFRSAGSRELATKVAEAEPRVISRLVLRAILASITHSTHFHNTDKLKECSIQMCVEALRLRIPQTDGYEAIDAYRYWMYVVMDYFTSSQNSLTVVQTYIEDNKIHKRVLFKPQAEATIAEVHPELDFSLHQPMEVRPNSWISATEGGYLTKEMQRVSPLHPYKQEVPQSVLLAVNKLQSVGFVVDREGVQVADEEVKTLRKSVLTLSKEHKKLKSDYYAKVSASKEAPVVTKVSAS